MAGKKGRSGRRAKSVEEKRLQIIDKGWEIVAKFLNDPTISVKEKMPTVEKIIVKDMPSEPLVNNTIMNKNTNKSNDTSDFDEREKKSKEELKRFFPRQ